MIDTIIEMLDFLVVSYPLDKVIVMGIIISLTVILLSIIKTPIKALTKKITNERLRKSANKIIILLAFLVSAIVWVLIHLFLPHHSAQLADPLISASFSIVLYNIGEGIITRSSAKKIVQDIVDETTDKIADKPAGEELRKNQKVGSAVSDFLEKVK